MSACTASRTGQPLAKELAGSDADAQMNFWHAMTDLPVTSNDQAFHGLLLYMDGKDDAGTYAARVANLKSRRMLPRGFDEPETAAVRRGTLAVAILRLIDARGGVTTTLLSALGPPPPRYAVRELMFLNVYPPSTPNQSFSGNEFVGIIGRVEDYQRGNPADVPAAVMPGQMSGGGDRASAATQPAAR